MKRMMMILALAALPAWAAKWDGTFGSLFIYTIEVNAEALNFASLFGPSTVTEIFVKSDDQSVSAFRIKIHMRTGEDWIVLSDKAPHGYMSGAMFPNIKVDDIETVTVTQLRDAESTILPK